MPAKKGQRKNRKNISRRQTAAPVAAAAQAGAPAAEIPSRKAKVPQLSMAEAAAARYPYVRGELRRIGILSAAMLVLLVIAFIIFS